MNCLAFKYRSTISSYGRETLFIKLSTCYVSAFPVLWTWLLFSVLSFFDEIRQVYEITILSMWLPFSVQPHFTGVNLVVPFFSFSGWGETESTWYIGHCWPIVPAPDDRWWWLWSTWWNENWQGKQKYSEKTCPSATLSTTNPTWPDLRSNPGRHGGKPATSRLGYGTALVVPLICCNQK
jgi:hypothetical protein